MSFSIYSSALYQFQLIQSANATQCYKPQAAEVGAVLNFGRNMFSFPLGFYVIPLSTKIGIQNAWILWGMLNVLFFLPMIALMWKGDKWRLALGVPKFQTDL